MGSVLNIVKIYLLDCVRSSLRITPALVILALCLFGDTTSFRIGRLFGAASAEILAVVRDPGTQWMMFLCAGMYLTGFVVRRQRWGETKLEKCGDIAQESQRDLFVLWLLGLVAVAVLLYALNYAQACKSTQAVTLLGAAMMGQAVRFTICDLRFTTEQQPRSKGTKAETCFLLGVVVVLAVAAVWQSETGRDFQYRSQARWTGPWDNPNTFGGLMGAGMVLTIGMWIAECGVRNGAGRSARWRKWLKRGMLFAGAAVMGFGLVKSYSRGAWVGTAVALAYLGYQVFRFSGHPKENRKIRGIREKQRQRTEAGQTTRGASFCSGLFHLPRILRIPRFRLFSGSGVVWLMVVVVSLGTLAFWALRDSEWLPARRAVSVANANDFSWRNRVAAWEGALQMMAEKPWFGYGWNQPERLYDQFYRPGKVSEGAAIQLNDYFTLGTTLGIPALICFVVYVGLAFRSAECGVRSAGAGEKLPGAESGLQGAGYRLQVEQPLREKTRIATNESASSRITHHASGSPIPHSALRTPHSSSPATRHPSQSRPTVDCGLWTVDSRAVCRAGALVLLVGFWFDGGLFKLATAATFWILLELGRED